MIPPRDKPVSHVKTRFAPSPTGFLHLGTTRTALFNYLFAKKSKGEFIVRIEDTDRERSKKEYEDDILNGLNWLGLSYDNFFRQSERKKIYKKYIERLISSGSAYISKEENSEGKEQGEIVRFKNPKKKIQFNDLIRGTIEFDTTELGDFIIARDLEHPLYNLASVIDDHEEHITHIIRGEDGIPNTPRQILLGEAIGAKRPIYVHVPLILAPDKTKLSKREGAIALNDFITRGYLKEAVINFLAFLGWNPGDDREIFSLEELQNEFSLERIGKSAATLNIDKLDWYNAHYMGILLETKNGQSIFRENIEIFLPPQLKDKIKGKEEIFEKILPIIKTRINRFSDVRNLVKDGEISFYFIKPDIKKDALIDPKTKPKLSDINKHLIYIIKTLSSLTRFDSESVKKTLWDYAGEMGPGEVLWPMRMALSGLYKSPDPFTIAAILGKNETLSRLEEAQKLLK